MKEASNPKICAVVEHGILSWNQLRCTRGLPDLVEILQIVVIKNNASFIVLALSAGYDEHFRSFQLEDTRNGHYLQQQQLGDTYPLAT